MGSGSSREVHYSESREREREREHGWSREGAGGDDSHGHAHGHRPYHRSSENSNGQDRSRSNRGRTGRLSGYGERYPEDAIHSGGTSARGSNSVKPMVVDAELTSIEVGRAHQVIPLHTIDHGIGSSAASIQPASASADVGNIVDARRPTECVLIEPLVSSYAASGSTSSSSNTNADTAMSSRRPVTSDEYGTAGHGQIELAAAEGGVRFEGVYVNAAVGDVRQTYGDEGLQAACETNFRRHRVNEMQERLRRYAGLPPSLDIQELERRGILSAESDLGVQRRRMEVMSGGLEDAGQTAGASANSDAFDLTAWSSPSLGAWDESPGAPREGRPLYAEPWETSITIRRPGSGSTPQIGTTEPANPPPVESSGISRDSTGRESRRNGGRRLWDALTRAASHRRANTSPPAAVVTEEVEDFEPSTDRWALREWRSAPDEGDGETGVVHSGRSLDLEDRRRRVRSQVWALQRLSNGLDSVPGHGTPCSRGGYHHGSRCSCESHSTTDDTNTRASISRIIMLAEALFEVLDEIHRQSVALSRSATVSLGSLPAPDTVVDAIPIRIHKKPESTKNICEDAAQCYICLVEYEEGDRVRVLPCQHEYHMACVDKWLKEIHRVCPLCRGNVCEGVGNNRPSTAPSA